MEPSSKTFILEEIPRETILKMVKLEQEWRYSKEIQDIYYQAYQENINIGTLIEDQIQQGILRNFGFNNNKSLEEYRKIPKTYWNDQEIKSSLFYMNLNIFQYPNIQIDDELINTPLLNLDKTETSLEKLSNKANGKPVVILAGSITWPPFRISLETYKQFYNDWKNKVDIYIVYILEAHFVEKDENGNFIGGWPIGYQYNYQQHKSIEDRIKMAKILEEEFKLEIPILVDTFENHFNNIYRPWPDRAFLFIDNKIKYMGQINEDGTRNTVWTNEIQEILKLL